MNIITVSREFGSGGSALISKTLGEGDEKKANELFSLFVYLIVIFGVVLGVLGFIFMPQIAMLLGAEGELLDNCILYGRVIIAVLPFNMLQFAFQTFFVTAEKSSLGFFVTLIAGIANIVLDALFILVFKWGLFGAAFATAISQVIGGLVPVIYFFLPNNSNLHLGKTSVDMASILKAASNGSSEFLSNISASIVSMLYNAQLLKYAGENGVASYGVLMYVGMIFFAIFIGYSMGTAPVIGYHYGAENSDEVKNIFKKSLVIILSSSVLMTVLALILSRPLASVFVGYSDSLMEMTVRGFNFYSFVFLFSGLVIFSSSFFTALNDGFVSALISFLRSAFFQVIFVLVLPLIWQINGIWASIVVADFSAAVIAVICLVLNRKKYHY